jgi:ribose 5-phosphate isomerase B
MDDRDRRLVIGADDAGLGLKDVIKAYLDERGVAYDDVGVDSPDATDKGIDYPDVAEVAATAIRDGRYARGILICGTGIGMAITANKVPGVRAALAHDVYSAQRARRSNDAQVLTMGARVIAPQAAEKVLDHWLASEFEGGGSAPKVEKMNAVDARFRAARAGSG